MDKQELIEKYAKFEEYVRKQGWNIEDLDYFDRGELAGERQLVSMLLNDLKQLDEPEITEEQAWKVIERDNHYHIAPADVWKYKEAIQKGMLPSDITGLEENPTISKKETVEVPWIVADFIEEAKENDWTIRQVFYQIIKFGLVNLDADSWIENNPETFARAWLDGYTIEQPKLLTIIIKDYDSTVFTTELPEDEAMELIEEWKQ